MIERLVRDGVVYALAAMMSRGVTFLIVPIYTRLLSPSAYGALDLMLTAGLLINLVVSLEIGQGLAREWAEQSEDGHRRKLAGTALTFTVLAHLGFLALALSTSIPLAQMLLGSSKFAPDLRAGLIFIAVNAVFLQIQSQFRWDLRARSYAVISVLYGFLTLALGSGFGYVHGLQGILWGQALAGGIGCLVGLAMLRGQFQWAIDREYLGRMLHYSLPLVPSGIAILASFYINRLILSEFSSLDEIGIFGVAQRIAGLTLLLIVGFQGALTPLIYRHHLEQGVPAQLMNIFEGFVGVAMLMCMSLSAFATTIVRWIAPVEFEAAGMLLPWLAPAALLSQMYIFAPGIAIARKTSWQLCIAVVSAILAIGLNLWLIPSHAALGAAIANCATSIAFLALWIAASQRKYSLPFRWRVLMSTIVIYVMALNLVMAVDHQHWSAAAATMTKLLIIVMLGIFLHRVGMFRMHGRLLPRQMS